MGRKRYLLRVLAVFSVLALLGAACNGDDPAVEDTEPRVVGEVEGCEEGASTDPDDRSPERAVARCEPNTPAPQPLAERQTVRMSSAFRAEFVAPILLAEAMGEFEAENLEFEWVELGFSDALPQIAGGQIDVAVGGTEAAFFNAVNRGIEVRWGLGNFFPPDAGDTEVAQTGLWVHRGAFSDPDDPDLADLEGSRLASAVGLGSVIAYPIAEAFEGAGVSLLDVTIENIPSPDMVLAIRNRAVDAAWLLDPFWLEADEDDDIILVATQTPGEPLGGLYFGEHMFNEKRDAAVAFVRAIIRTINTHLDGNYKQDADVVSALSEASGIPEDTLLRTPPLLFDWEIRTGTTDATQGYFIEFGTVDYDEVIPEDRVVDRSLYLEAVGHSG